jgi:hypothetical protein
MSEYIAEVSIPRAHKLFNKESILSSTNICTKYVQPAQLSLNLFLGFFVKLLKEIISFVMSVRLSERPSALNNSAPTR